MKLTDRLLAASLWVVALPPLARNLIDWCSHNRIDIFWFLHHQ